MYMKSEYTAREFLSVEPSTKMQKIVWRVSCGKWMNHTNIRSTTINFTVRGKKRQNIDEFQHATSTTPKTKHRYRIAVAYNGTRFGGWQKQDLPKVMTPKNKHMFEQMDNVKETVQGALEKSLNYYRFAYREAEEGNVNIIGSSRTDANVHAFYNTCHVDLTHSDQLTELGIKRMMNKYLRGAELLDDLKVVDVKQVPDYFHSRYCAYERYYMYRVIEITDPWFDDTTLTQPFLANRVYFTRRENPMDVNAMKEASEVFIGNHNFSSLCKLSSILKNKKDPFRQIHSVDIEEHSVPEFLSSTMDYKNVREIRFFVRGRSFLHHQVRYMVQAMLQIGDGSWTVSDLKQVIDDERQLQQMKLIPGWGLYLCHVKDCSQFLTSTQPLSLLS